MQAGQILSAQAASPTAVGIALSHEECLALLERERIGRIAITASDGAPLIRPLNYRFDRPSQSVVFRTLPGVKLHALLRAGRAAFEIDGVEADGASAFSVIVSGVCEEVTRPLEVAALERVGLWSWAGAQARTWFRIRASRISGRRFTDG
jgi:nitroimidazol reductase NimA-like FMN-containing flavoprotein (pyridoxamine 5'-phosphate oxidase superfamily)